MLISHAPSLVLLYFFFHDPATTEIYTLSLHDALPIYPVAAVPRHHPHHRGAHRRHPAVRRGSARVVLRHAAHGDHVLRADRKSTRLNSSHVEISYAVFCLKKKKKDETMA